MTRPPAAISGYTAGRRDSGVEIRVGRALATSVHPVAAWRLLSLSGRLLILVVYAAVGFVIGALLLFRFA